MPVLFLLFTILFVVVSGALVLIILVQRPQGGGLATAFGGAGGGNDTAFGGRTGDALTVATVGGFFVYLIMAIGLNIADPSRSANAAQPAPTPAVQPAETDGTTPPATGGEAVPPTATPTPAATPTPTPAAPEPAPTNTPPAVQPTTPPASGGASDAGKGTGG